MVPGSEERGGERNLPPSVLAEKEREALLARRKAEIGRRIEAMWKEGGDNKIERGTALIDRLEAEWDLEDRKAESDKAAAEKAAAEADRAACDKAKAAADKAAADKRMGGPRPGHTMVHAVLQY